MKTDNLTAKEAERALQHDYKVQPMGWDNKCYQFMRDEKVVAKTLHEELEYSINDFLKATELFRIYTTDEDVAKWAETKEQIFSKMNNETQEAWRRSYKNHLKRLPELTEGKSATVSDEVIEEWWNGLSVRENQLIAATCRSFDELRFNEKQLVRQAYHKAHEKVEPSPQAYKFPYNNVLFDEVNRVLIYSNSHKLLAETFINSELSNEDLQYICEAINEKRQRDGI